MSLSNPTAKNPATRFFNWRGGAEGEAGKETGGKVVWYDKEAEEQKEMPLPFRFIVLDELHTIAGFSDADQSSYWSNEVRDLQAAEFVVRTSKGIQMRGKYADLDGVKSKGAKYAKSVYIAFKDETDELTIGNIKIMGSALTAWIEFQKKFDVTKCAIILEGSKKAKKGTNVYFTPIFDAVPLAAATKDAAVELDKDLQRYLETYLTRKPEIEEAINEDEAEEEIEIEDLDKQEEPDKGEAQPKTEVAAAPAKPAGDDTINLKDVPF